MLKRIPMLGLFFLLGCAVALLPMACGSDDNNNGSDGSTMTGS